MKHTINVELRQVEKALTQPHSATNAWFSLPKKIHVELAVKMKMAELILNLRRRGMQRHKKFGLLVILGWKKQWQNYADTPDAAQDLFARQKINIMKVTPTADRRRGNIVNTINFDGAILIDPLGNVLHSGTMIEGLRPRATAHKLSPRRAPDLSSQFGFKRKVHMRHITAITSSYTFHGTTVFTISEETDDMHIFEDGKIIYSTVKGEPVRP